MNVHCKSTIVMHMLVVSISKERLTVLVIMDIKAMGLIVKVS